MQKRLFIYLLISCFWLSAFAQHKLHIHTDKAFYSSGEQIGFTISNTSSTESEIIYVEILNENSEILSHLSTKSDGRIATGIFDIPLDWKSDWYIIRAYSIWVPSIEIKDMAYKALAIYSEFDETQIKQESPVVSLSSDQNSFQIQSNKETYQKGEEAEFRIIDPEGSAASSWVITVLDKSSFIQKQVFPSLEPKINYTVPRRKAEIGEIQQKLLYLGKVQNFGNNGLAAIYIAEEKDFNWLSLNEEQTFGIELEDFSGIKHAEVLSMQAIGGLSFLTPEMNYPSFSLTKGKFAFGELPYTPELVKYLEASRKRRVIEDIFNKLSLQDTVSQNPGISFVKADKSYAPSEFIRFSNTKDFFNEVATFTRLKKSADGSHTIHLILEKNVFAQYEPAIFLNGHILDNIDEILDMDIDEISRIDLYRKERTILKQFKTLGRNGVIAVYTKNPNIRPKTTNKIELRGFQENPPMIKAEGETGIPNLSPRPYWNAALMPNEQGELSFSFKLGDDLGEYVVVAEKYTENGRKSASKSFIITGKIN